MMCARLNRSHRVEEVANADFEGKVVALKCTVRCAGDYRTAQDLVRFLDGFMDRFPEYSGRPFWITGESYGELGWPALTSQRVLFRGADQRQGNPRNPLPPAVGPEVVD